MTTSEATARLVEVEFDPFATSPIERSFPTTAAQREVFLAAVLGREASLAFNESISLTLRGALDAAVMKAALRALTDRHEALRATFDADGANMLVFAETDVPIELVDLADADAAHRDRELHRLRAEAVETTFDLVKGPLARAALVRTAADVHELIFTAHHIVCDGWSFGVISRDLMTIYRALRDGRAPTDLPAAGRFGDYALAELDPVRRRAAEADEKYWVDMFDHAGQPVLDLPTDRPRGRHRTFASRRLDQRLPAGVVEGARRLGAGQGVSLFSTLFGVFAALIDRLGGEGQVVIGVPAAGQPAAGMTSLVGHCINTLPVLVTTDRAQSVASFLKQTGTRVLDAYDHQTCTLGQLLTKLNVRREPGRLPLASVLFNVDTPIPDDALAADGLAVSLRSNPRAFENFDLFVNASHAADGMVLECQYNTDLFDGETVDRWLRLYQAALERAAAAPEKPLSALFSATQDDRRQLDALNATQQDYPRDARLESLFALQVERSPDAVALVCGEEELSYRALDARSNAVARALVDRGIGPGQLVGMGCGRGLHMLAAMLGTWKAGAAYVPLDPAYPPSRRAYMCADAGLSCIVADGQTGTVWPAGVEVLHADELALDAPALPPRGDAHAAAYVIYTSGSTGKPKGVAVHHRAVVNFLISMAREPGLTADDRLVAVTSTSFDIAVLELILPLTVGARVIVAERERVVDGAALRALIEARGATVLQATPASWRLLLDAGWAGGAGFKALVGGETLQDDLAAKLTQCADQVWNMYGPTETTVWSTCWPVPRRHGGIRIGRPIANTRVFVLDEAMQVCPIGVPGELYIGGDGVAIGYWGQPELSAQRFTILDGARVYRTGDRARWRNDGTLEHLGRLDFQVKVRGYRIELGEIEAVLLQHPDVERAVVLAREDEPGDVRLVAYVVGAGGASVDFERLRDLLRRQLPDYMLPAHGVQLAAIPLLPNGKINRHALPRPSAEEHTRKVRRSPETATEVAVLQTMEEVLNLRGLGIDDDFFAVGGHSLLAARLTSRLNKAFDLSLPLRTVFEHATAAALSAAVDASRGGSADAIVRIVRQANQAEGPLTLMQERILFMEELHPGRVVYNTPSAHRFRGPFDRVAFGKAVDAMIARQPSLRTQIAYGPDGPVQRVVGATAFALPFEDLSALDASDRERVLMQRMQAVIDQPIDLRAAPLMRAALYRLAPDEHVFLFMPHHIVWDGWSFDLLYEEMAEQYAAVLDRRAGALPTLPVSYIDYAVWHREWMRGAECERQTEYWRKRFASIDPPRALPTDRQRRAGMTGQGRVEWVHVDKGLTERLRELAQQRGATLNMLMLALYAAQIAQATSGSTFVIGIPVRGRLAGEVEPLMGFFNNLLPMPLRIDPAMDAMAWLGVVKNELIEVFAHQDVPFEHLATQGEIARHSSGSGLYQTLFSFQDARSRPRRWGALQHSSVLVMQKGATEDFGLWLMEVPDGLEGGINFNSDLFDVQTAQMFRDRFLGLLRRFAEHPDQTLAELTASPGPDRDAFVAWIDARKASVTNPVTRPASAAARELSAPARRLAEIWARLIGIDATDIHGDDNFFDLGGTSILAMRAVAEARAKLGIEIDPRRYVYETLRQLALAADVEDHDSDTGAIAVIAGIWARLLGIEADDIHPDDNFFDLGGTSILAIEAVAGMNKELDRKIVPRRMVHESVRQLAAKAEADAEATTASSQPVTKTPDGASGAGLVSRVLGRLGRRSS